MLSTCRECKARLEAILVDKLPGGPLQFLADVNHLHTGFHPALNVLAGLSVRLGRLPAVTVSSSVEGGTVMILES